MCVSTEILRTLDLSSSICPSLEDPQVNQGVNASFDTRLRRSAVQYGRPMRQYDSTDLLPDDPLGCFPGSLESFAQ